jgi:hypothetical protein
MRPARYAVSFDSDTSIFRVDSGEVGVRDAAVVRLSPADGQTHVLAPARAGWILDVPGASENAVIVVAKPERDAGGSQREATVVRSSDGATLWNVPRVADREQISDSGQTKTFWDIGDLRGSGNRVLSRATISLTAVADWERGDRSPLGLVSARDAPTGTVVWQGAVECIERPDIALDDVPLGDLMPYGYSPSCGTSADTGFLVMRLDDGTVVDRQPLSGGLQFAKSSAEVVWLGASNGGYRRYEAAKLFAYDIHSGRRLHALLVAPDAPHDPDTWGNIGATAVAFSRDYVYAHVGQSVYRYPTTGTATPARIDHRFGTWLGVAYGDRLYFRCGDELRALESGGQTALGYSIAGARGPFVAMLIKASVGYALATDGRIVEIDLANDHVTDVVETPCRQLRRVDVFGRQTLVVCSTDPHSPPMIVGL